MTSDPFFGTSGPRDAKIMLVGEAWGADEASAQRPFVGLSGRELDKMLAEAGIDRKECFATNLIPARPPGNDMWNFFHPSTEVKALKLEPLHGLFPRPELVSSLKNLEEQVRVVNPKLIIGCGNYPLWAFTEAGDIANDIPKERNPQHLSFKVPTKISYWRGSQLRTSRIARGVPFLPIYHPAGIMRNWDTRPITVHDLRVRVRNALRGSWDKPTYNFVAPPTFREALEYLRRLESRLERGPVELVTDIETKSRKIIACIGFTYDGLSAICIPFIRPKADRSGYDNYWSFNEEVILVRHLRTILNHPNSLLIGQNFIYDSQYFSRLWRTLPRVHSDTMLNQHAMFPGTPKDLAYLASLYATNYYSFWKEDSKEWEESGDLAQHLLYNCDDCIYTWQVYQKQKDALVRMDKVEQAAFLLREWSLAFKLMDRGTLIDQKIRGEMSIRVMEAAQERQEWLNKVIPPWVRPAVKKGAKPWYTSAQQQMRLFYEELGLKSVHHRKTGNPTVNDEALNEIKLRYPELTRIVDTIAELRSLGVFQNNFLSAAIDPDGRMRCSFNVAGTETFRWSSSENAFGRGTNLQNIPKGDD